MSVDATPSRMLNQIGIAAVLGTDRAGDAPTAAAELLSRAAVAQARARAGHVARPGATAIAACPSDATPIATPNQAIFLERSLQDWEFNCIDEWCELANARGMRVPPILVPALLEWWSNQSHRAASVMHATGTCGPWLATLNPQWRKPVEARDLPEDIDQLWQTEAASERYGLLRTAVHIDPNRAVTLIASTWDTDGAEERRRFVETLARNLTPAYEPFLEAGLDDRSKTVRREAARVLAMIPGSALRARMTQRAASILQVARSKTLLRREKIALSVEPPNKFEPSWERDGIEESRSMVGAGNRAYWMRQILARADVSHWTTLTGLDPAAIIAALEADDFWSATHLGLTESLSMCPTQPDAIAWCEALIPIAAKAKIPDHTHLARVWRALLLDQSERLRQRFMRALEPQSFTLAWTVAAADDRAWTSAFAAAALTHLETITPAQKDPAELRPLIDSVAKLVHPSGVDRFEQLVRKVFPDGLTPKIQQCLDRARARADMHKEFTP